VLIAYEDEAKHGEKSRFKNILNNFQTNDRVLIILLSAYSGAVSALNILGPKPMFKLTSLKRSISLSEKPDYVLIAYEDEAKHGEKSRFKNILNNFQTNDRVLP
jgi:hypothetical protein